MRRTTALTIASSVLLGSLILSSTAFAQEPQHTAGGAQHGRGHGSQRSGHAPAVFGTVSAISGNTITVTSRGFGFGQNSSTTTTYAVDATNAKIDKNGANATVGTIAVGDMIMVQGTVSGTNVTATAIHDGIAKGRDGDRNNDRENGSSTAMQFPQGNGQPIVGGTVTAVSSSTVTITNKSNVTFTIDATNAKIDKNGATSTVSSIAIGDSILAQGTINGSSVTASS
ncbi:MAG TPA: DUF5666 domain-containing protein, partial [Candidatus Paceibacterota bacterium]